MHTTAGVRAQSAPPPRALTRSAWRQTSKLRMQCAGASRGTAAPLPQRHRQRQLRLQRSSSCRRRRPRSQRCRVHSLVAAVAATLVCMWPQRGRQTRCSAALTDARQRVGAGVLVVRPPVAVLVARAAVPLEVAQTALTRRRIATHGAQRAHGCTRCRCAARRVCGRCEL
jgi:hypothetical protein